MKGKRTKGIDVMKVLMAFVVVSIHTTSWPLLGLKEVAVPFFFIVSGYFLCRKLTGDRKADLGIIREWVFKILKLYLIWTAVYLPFTVYGFLQDGLSLKQSLLLFVRNLLFVGENFMSWPLWYLLAMIWSGILAYLLRALKAPIWVMLLTGVVLAAIPHYLGGNALFCKVFKGADNLVFTGPFYIALGGLLKRYHFQLPLWAGILVTAAGLAGMQFTMFALPIAAAGFFLLARELPMRFVSEELSKTFRDVSETIYLVHMIFAGILMLVFGLDKGALLFGLTSLFSATAAYMRYKWNNR